MLAPVRRPLRRPPTRGAPLALPCLWFFGRFLPLGRRAGGRTVAGRPAPDCPRLCFDLPISPGESPHTRGPRHVRRVLPRLLPETLLPRPASVRGAPLRLPRPLL